MLDGSTFGYNVESTLNGSLGAGGGKQTSSAGALESEEGAAPLPSYLYLAGKERGLLRVGARR